MAGNHRCRCCGGGQPATGCYTVPTAGARLDINGSYRLIRYFDFGSGRPPLTPWYELEFDVSGHVAGVFSSGQLGSLTASYSAAAWHLVWTARERWHSVSSPVWTSIPGAAIQFVRQCHCRSASGENYFRLGVTPAPSNSIGTGTTMEFGAHLRIGGSTPNTFSITGADGYPTSIPGGTRIEDSIVVGGGGGSASSVSVGGTRKLFGVVRNELLAEATGTLAGQLSGFNEAPLNFTLCQQGQGPGGTDQSLSGPVGPAEDVIELARALRGAA